MSAIINSVNQGMVQAEIDLAFRMFQVSAPTLGMARGHLHNAKNISPFSGDTEQTKRIEETIAAIKHLAESFDALTRKEKVIQANEQNS